jgi:hypothetical protein
MRLRIVHELCNTQNITDIHTQTPGQSSHNHTSNLYLVIPTHHRDY